MASARLTKTISSSTGKIFTMSVWLKKADNASINTLFHLTSDSNTNKYIEIASKSGYAIDFQLKNGTSGDNGTFLRRRLTRLFRDHHAWYHIVIRFDSTNSTAGDRARIYINGEQATDVDQDSTPDVPLNFVSDLNNANSNLSLAGFVGGSHYLNGQLAHFHFTDGYSYAPTEFGETDATTGIWKPKTSPSVTYGTNGFFLKFDNSANMGLDSSGQGNNFTTNGTIIQNKDTPNNVFATWNPLEPTSNLTFSNTNNTLTSGAGSKGVPSTLAVSSGKFYFENKLGSSAGNVVTGIAQDNSFTYVGSSSTSYGHWNGNIYNNGSTTSYGGTASNNDIVGIGLDLDNNKMYVSINGTWQNSANPSSGTGGHTINAGTYHFAASGDTSQSWNANFGNGYFGTTAVSSAQNPDDGNGIFEYDPPTGYRALCTKSINAEEYS
jgi:hypothetical protein|tara:strand:+ start:83 stop:1393 length:1311 start_codon:yes stop_codon:yes gene_type:complete